jgi:ferredoxin
MRVAVDLAVCQGHGVCHMSAPDVFELDEDDGHAIVVSDPVAAGMEADAQLAADSCPERAISVLG